MTGPVGSGCKGRLDPPERLGRAKAEILASFAIPNSVVFFSHLQMSTCTLQ